MIARKGKGAISSLVPVFNSWLCTQLPLLVTFANDFSFLLLKKENCLCFMEKTRYRNQYGQLLFILKKRESGREVKEKEKDCEKVLPV